MRQAVDSCLALVRPRHGLQAGPAWSSETPRVASSPPREDGTREDGSSIPRHTEALSDKTLLSSLHILTFHSSQKQQQEYPQVSRKIAWAWLRGSPWTAEWLP